MQAVFNFSYYITGSKSALTLATKGSPCRSYTTIQIWIADQGKGEIHCSQDPNVVTFDNNQVLLKLQKIPEISPKNVALFLRDRCDANFVFSPTH